MPSLRTSLLAAALAATVQAQRFNYSQIANTTSSDCPAPGTAHMIVARASGEPLGYGVIGLIKDRLLKSLPGSNAEYVVYPATLTDYPGSETAGVSAMKALVETYISKNCAEPLVLMGYSQGAHVTADYLSGQNVVGFTYNASLTDPAPESILDKVAAVTIMGDPSINITNNPFHVGNSTKPGLFERAANSSAVLNGISGKIQSYCDALDPYCASAGNFDNISVHTGYTWEYGQDAEDFILRQVKAWYEQSGSGSGNETSGTPTQSGGGAQYTGAANAIGSGLVGTAALVFALGGALLGGL